jgi:hypothetical protein
MTAGAILTVLDKQQSLAKAHRGTYSGDMLSVNLALPILTAKETNAGRSYQIQFSQCFGISNADMLDLGQGFFFG